MRLSTDSVERGLAQETLRAAHAAGVNLFDTAAAYHPGAKRTHHNERLLAETLDLGTVQVVTKCGMARPNGGWLPDGRRKAVLADAAGSAEALGRPADVLLLHAPDPKTKFDTTLRAMVAAREAGYAHALGLSNVRVAELERASEHFEVAMVQVALSPVDAKAAHGGVVEWCRARGIPVLAHSPLGGPKKWKGLGKDEELSWLGEHHEVSAQTVALAWLYGLGVVPLPGARRPETARLAGRAATLSLRDDEAALLDDRFALGRLLRTPRSERVVRGGPRRVTVFVGIPGAGKSTAARTYTEAGALRLSRDDRGGTLAQLAEAMRGELRDGADHVLMDATYPTRAQRSVVLEAAWEEGAHVRAVHFETPPAQAQINVVDRMLAAHGGLPSPAEIQRLGKEDARFVPPAAQRRFLQTLEPPLVEEGFTEVVRVPFERSPRPEDTQAGVAVSLDAVARGSRFENARLENLAALALPVLVFGWVDSLARAEALRSAWTMEAGGALELALCTHPAGPLRCWCRPPAPGLVLAWMRPRRIAPAKLVVYARDGALAEALGAQLQPPSALA